VSRCGTVFAGAPSHSNRGGAPFAVSIDLIKARANERVREIAAELLPNGREESGYWRTGSIADEPGQSLAVTLSGPDKGMWCDYAASGPEGGGNLIQLAALAAFRGDVGQAIAWLKSKLGLDDLDPGRLRKLQAEAVEQRARDDKAAIAAAEDRRRKALGLFLRGQSIKDTPASLFVDARDLARDARPSSQLARLPRRGVERRGGAQAAVHAGRDRAPGPAHRDAPDVDRA
jgi:hypothetical protein